jgi:uncharacterized membrane protein YhaH (DUF805 family)
VFVLVVDFVFVVGYNPHQHKTQYQKHENHVFTVAFFTLDVFVLVIDFAFVVRYNHKTQDYAFVVMLCFLILVIASQLKTIITIKTNIHKEYKINVSFVLIH